MNKVQWLGLVFVIFIASCGFGLVGVFIYEGFKDNTPTGNQTLPVKKPIYVLTVIKSGLISQTFRSENRLYAEIVNGVLTVYEVQPGSVSYNAVAIAQYTDVSGWAVEVRQP